MNNKNTYYGVKISVFGQQGNLDQLRGRHLLVGNGLQHKLEIPS